MKLLEKKINLKVDICSFVDIFDNKLLSVRYCSYELDEYSRLLDEWGDVEYLWSFAVENKVKDRDCFVKNILENVEFLEDILHEIYTSQRPLENFFQPLNDLETGFNVLSKQKGKLSNLRVYALKIDEDYFLITGGAIKMSEKMDEHPGTKIEKSKINRVREYLSSNDVFDIDSFQAYKLDQYE